MKFGIFIILTCLYFPSKSQTDDQSIIIIGAGLSGFAAARKLLEHNFKNVKILEAENRIGGRVYSVPFAGGLIDSGAQWVHGEDGNSIYEMVSPSFTFGITPFHLDPIFVLSNGTKPVQDDFQELYSLGSEIYEELSENRPSRDSIGEIFLRNFESALRNPKYQHIGEETRNFVKMEMHKDINGDFGSSSWFDISAILNYEMEEADGEQYLTWKKQGFITVFDYLTKKLPNPSEYLDIDSKILFNKTVVNIAYDMTNSSSTTVITCSDGTSYTAKHVIFTPSLGILKAHHQTLFTPALPTSKINAIENIAMGIAAKFFMEFEASFWTQPGVPFLKFAVMWTDAHKDLAVSTNRSYLTDIVGIYAVDQFPNLLEIFLVGSNIRQFEEATDQKVLDDVMWMLDMFLPNFRPIPKPKAIHKTKWLTHENFLGGYTYPSMTQQRNRARFSDLAASIENRDRMPVLLFAGEATSSEFASTANGAVDSGFKAAEEIIDYYSGQSGKESKKLVILALVVLTFLVNSF